jgi:nitrate/nitrite transport system ATP-binding protein
MRQRVALARTLATSPEVLLLDEPLGALDALTRGALQLEIARIWERERTTCVMITNDIDEAILLADRIIPLSTGPGATLGPSFPVELTRPRNRTELNHDPAFKQLRNSVTTWLVQCRQQALPARQDSAPLLTLPDLAPRDLTSRSQTSSVRLALNELLATDV